MGGLSVKLGRGVKQLEERIRWSAQNIFRYAQRKRQGDGNDQRCGEGDRPVCLASSFVSQTAQALSTCLTQNSGNFRKGKYRKNDKDVGLCVKHTILIIPGGWDRNLQRAFTSSIYQDILLMVDINANRQSGASYPKSNKVFQSLIILISRFCNILIC